MLDDELRALVSVDASPDFTARVGEAVRNDSSRPVWAVQAAFALAAALVLAVWLPGFFTENRRAPVATTLVATPVGRADVPFREALTDVRDDERRSVFAVLAAGSATGSNNQTSLAAMQIDPVERRALRALFAHPPRASYVELPETPDSPLVIPAVRVQPLQVESLSEGASQ